MVGRRISEILPEDISVNKSQILASLLIRAIYLFSYYKNLSEAQVRINFVHDTRNSYNCIGKNFIELFSWSIWDIVSLTLVCTFKSTLVWQNCSPKIYLGLFNFVEINLEILYKIGNGPIMFRNLDPIQKCRNILQIRSNKIFVLLIIRYCFCKSN